MAPWNREPRQKLLPRPLTPPRRRLVRLYFPSQITKIRKQKPVERSAAREAALKEVKERNKKAKAAKIAASKGSSAASKQGKQKGSKGASGKSVGR